MRNKKNNPLEILLKNTDLGNLNQIDNNLESIPKIKDKIYFLETIKYKLTEAIVFQEEKLKEKKESLRPMVEEIKDPWHFRKIGVLESMELSKYERQKKLLNKYKKLRILISNKLEYLRNTLNLFPTKKDEKKQFKPIAQELERKQNQSNVEEAWKSGWRNLIRDLQNHYHWKFLQRIDETESKNKISAYFLRLTKKPEKKFPPRHVKGKSKGKWHYQLNSTIQWIEKNPEVKQYLEGFFATKKLIKS